MPYSPQELPYVKSPEALATYDYFDSVIGVGFKKFYPVIGQTSTATQHYLTTDSSIASDSVWFQVDSSQDIDFDITVEVPFTIAAKDAIFNWRQVGGDSTAGVTWKIIHYDGSTETVLGTVIGKVTTTATEQLSVKATLTRKFFEKGDILRINPNVTIGGSGNVPFDPSGGESSNDTEGRAVNSQLSLLLRLQRQSFLYCLFYNKQFPEPYLYA